MAETPQGLGEEWLIVGDCAPSLGKVLVDMQLFDNRRQLVSDRFERVVLSVSELAVKRYEVWSWGRASEASFAVLSGGAPRALMDVVNKESAERVLTSKDRCSGQQKYAQSIGGVALALWEYLTIPPEPRDWPRRASLISYTLSYVPSKADATRVMEILWAGRHL